MSEKNYKTKSSQYYCTTCDGYFDNLKWDGYKARCPNCESVKWLDIKEEAAAVANIYHRGTTVPSDEMLYP